MHESFRHFAGRTSTIMGSSWAFLTALAVIAIWAMSGPIFHYSETWQLMINSGTTIVTFLMVFLIQNTQNRESKALHIKLDALIQGTKGAMTRAMDAEELPDEELERLKQLVTYHTELKHQKRRREATIPSPHHATFERSKAD
jgi:low affinity Fe/Cu permease